ncbi:serine/threonine-protein kinase [Pseudomonas sivasensis]|uniref:serine/threonine-protein kinase n=1 Tax=Pseudomonas sivasensis TaxID=1880678 RepID=UPI003D01E326
MSAVTGPPNLLAGRYHLERELGTGGMGVVYRARDLLHEAFGEPNAWVALKLLGDTLAESPDGHVLLYSEFALTRSLRHDHVVRTFSFEVDTPRQVAFFTMELLTGMTLDRLLKECPDGLPWRELKPIAMQLLDALAYAHQQGVLHGDVKPANIMVGEQGVQLFDFGLGHGEAQQAAGLPGLSRSRLNAWTPAYAAPELMAGGRLSPRADLYGAACVIYELAQGNRPGKGQLNKPLPRPRQLPRQCWSALRSALEVDPERRTLSAEELCEAINGRRRHWFF